MKPILDACCGGKMFYFDKNDPRVLFQDIRSFKDKDIYKGRTFSVEPDVVADFTSMPYPDNSFRMVVFDPPHLKYTSEKETKGWQMEKYGWLPRGQWRQVLEKGFYRVLSRPGARRLPHLQVERDGHKGLRGAEAHSGKARLRPYLRQESKHALDMFYESLKEKEMKIRANHFRYVGRYCLWLTPSILLSGTKYDNPDEYENWFQMEFMWLFWGYTLWIDYKKNKKKENK